MREAVHLMEMALPRFQQGSDKYRATLDCLQKVSKVFPASAEVPGIQNTQLMALMQKAKQDQMIQAAMRQQQMAAGAQGGGQPPAAAAPAPMQQAE